MKIYLSIDLDFWDRRDLFSYRNYSHLRKFLKMAIGATSNIRVVDSHETLLKHVNQMGKEGCDTLINVDFHADLYDRYNPKHPEQRNTFNCGTWINYVNFRRQGLYQWYFPYLYEEADKYGYCHEEIDDPKANPFKNIRVSGWGRTEHESNLHPEKKIDWLSVKAVGISFSYDWLALGKSDRIVEEAEKVLGFRPRANPYAKVH